MVCSIATSDIFSRGKPPRFPDLDWLYEFSLLETPDNEQVFIVRHFSLNNTKTSYQLRRTSVLDEPEPTADPYPRLVPVGDSLSCAKERMLEDMKNILEPTPITPTEERIQLAKREKALV